MNYLLFLNQNPMGVLHGYKATDPLQLVYTGVIDAKSNMEAVEEVFYKFNNNYPPDYKERSLSVGDVVIVGGVAFQYNSIGATEVPQYM